MHREIFVNGRFLTQRTTGVQRYALETLLALDALLASGEAPQLKFTLLAPRGTQAPPLEHIQFRCAGTFSGNAWEQLSLPLLTRGSWLLSFGPTGPIAKKHQVVTMHDAAVYAVPRAFSWKFRAWYKALLPLLAHRIPLVMTVSEFSKSELARHCRIASERLRVAGGAWQHVRRLSSDASILEEHGLRPNGYVLAVSSVTPHKNFGVIVDAITRLAEIDVSVAVAGAVNHEVFGRTDLRSRKAVKLLGYVDDQQLRALYEGAAAFVYPSLYEGFGLPPLEAMALGCPVIASNAASIPEICGDAVLYFPPRDADALARAIERVVVDGRLRSELIAKGRARIQHFSWTACARQHLDTFVQLDERARAHEALPGKARGRAPA